MKQFFWRGHTTISLFWTTALLACNVLSCNRTGGFEGLEDHDIGVVEQAALWDVGDKPVPKNFLSRYSIYTSNKCCLTGTVGGNGDSVNCNKFCGKSPTGLVTEEGVAKADDYYAAIGETSLDTLEKWKANYNFPKRRVGESLDAYRARAKVVVYYNLTELGLGRELGCSMNGNDVACYVTNYGGQFNDQSIALDAAVLGQEPRNTVVISYKGSRASRYAVQFAAFGADGKRIKKAQLDNHGARPIPQICMSCHGGHWNPDVQGLNGKYGLAEDARFLPLMTGTIQFPTSAPYRQVDQEGAILHNNNLAWLRRYETLTGRQQDYLHRSYNATGANLAFKTGRTAQAFDMVTPLGWTGHDAYYRYGVLPFCDTCHMAADSQHVTRTSADTTAANFLPPLGTLSRLIARGWERDVVGDYGFRNGMTTAGYSSWAGVTGYGAQRGTYASTWKDTEHSAMPHAETTFARFWGDTSSGLQQCTLGSTSRPPVDCFFYELGIWPTPATATPPNTIHPPVPVTAKASLERDCGQGNFASITNTSGTNDGRYVNSNQCSNGCKKSEVYCPGTEGAGTNTYLGARYECAPYGTYGACLACGAIGQMACYRVGANCDSSYNPNCLVAPACHEGVNVNGTCTATNIAMGKQASQSSTYELGHASLAVDGGTTGNYASGSVSHTLGSANEWWKVDLGAQKKTKRIEIYNRTDCCADRLKSAIVEYSTDNANWYTFPGGDFDSTVGTAQMTLLTSGKPIQLRYLRVRMRTTNYLSLAEVKVIGW